MIDEQLIQQQLAHTLNETDYDFLGEKYEGKVRDCYTSKGIRYLITTDRISCFDVVLAAIPFKGQILSELAAYWFEQTKDIIQNHIIDIPDPNVMVVRESEVMPVEVIVRGYLAGSAWRDYQAGKAISGIQLEPGMKMHQQFQEPLLTPSTKAEKGVHDEPISREEILQRGIVEERVWDQVEEVAKALFARGTELAARQGLLLVDTKYEFGFCDGALVLVDEIHTIDSSRYWVAETYKDAFEREAAPEMLDKEKVRRWLMERGYMGDGPAPAFPPEYLIEVSQHYIESYERITGSAPLLHAGDTKKRIEHNLREYSEFRSMKSQC